MTTGNNIVKSWYALSNEDGVILGVYGSALGTMARERGRELKSQCGARVALHHIALADRPGQKPQVGNSISMKGAIEWL